MLYYWANQARWAEDPELKVSQFVMAGEKFTVLSSTLAEIYMRQGHFDKAKRMYERLLSKDQTNELYKSRLQMLSKDSPEAKKLKVLSSLLKRIEERRDEKEPDRQGT